jgi:hypothetical protein
VRDRLRGDGAPDRRLHARPVELPTLPARKPGFVATMITPQYTRPGVALLAPAGDRVRRSLASYSPRSLLDKNLESAKVWVRRRVVASNSRDWETA